MDLSIKKRETHPSESQTLIKQEITEDEDIKPNVEQLNVAIKNNTNIKSTVQAVSVDNIKKEITPEQKSVDNKQILSNIANSNIETNHPKVRDVNKTNVIPCSSKETSIEGIASETTNKRSQPQAERGKKLKISNDPDVDIELEDPEIVAILNNGNGVMYSCNVCRESSDSLKNFNVHAKTHDNVDKLTYTKFYTCGICMYACKKPLSLVNHRNLHTSKKYSCDMCDYSTNRPCILKSHKLGHSDERPFQCELCSFKTVQEKYLKYHMKKHSEEKEFKCDRCDQEFTYKKDLREHTLHHLNEKNYSCAFCEESFYTKRELNQHKIKHDDEKKYKCDLCSFSTKWFLGIKYHKSVHERKDMYECPQCDYKTLRLNEFKTHQSSHEPLTMVCEYCQYSCKKSSTMEKHMVKHFEEGIY